MAATKATAVQAGTVTVVVTRVPKRFFPWWRGTVTITSADFVGRRVDRVKERVESMRSWNIKDYYVLNDMWLNPEEVKTTILQIGDKLVLYERPLATPAP